MNMKNKEITMRGYAACPRTTILLLASLVFLLSSCEKEVSEYGSGEEVILSFTVNYAGYDEADVITRGFGANQSETRVVALENDWYMQATLKPDTAGVLRAGELRADLVDGQKICLAAFGPSPGSPQVGSTATYTYSSEDGKLVPVGPPLGVEPGSSYRFVAYSYYNNIPDEYPSTTNIEPSAKDLVWGYEDKLITTSDRNVSITMTHLLAKVNVSIKVTGITDTEITEIEDVNVMNGKISTLIVRDGFLFPGSDIDQMVEWTDITLPAAEITSDTRMVFPYSYIFPSNAKINIGKMTLDVSGELLPLTFTNIPIEFDDQLLGGMIYTLEVSFKRSSWAGSNIYWDDVDRKLTFDAASSSSRYQGVLFKWGSLIGISPLGANNDDVALYIPPVGGGSWDASKTVVSTDSPWPDAGSWSKIPYITTGNSANNTDNYLYDNDDFSNYKGDICSYLTGGVWRIPNGAEFGVDTDYGPFITDERVTVANAAGTSQMYKGRVYNAGPVFFPASGSRPQGNGGLTYYNYGGQGYYWSGSAITGDSDTSLGLAFANGWMDVYAQNRDGAHPIRCLKN
jgi:hypothetical protein